MLNPGASMLIWPMMAQLLLTFVVFAVMARRRVAALNNREVRIGDVALSGEAFPTAARQAANNFTNQFETPVLFYVLVVAAILTGATGLIMTLLAWIYVASRAVHAAIHVTGNRVQQRALAFFAGVATLFAMWIGVVITAL